MKWNIFSVFSTSGGENCQLIFFDFVPTHRLKRSMCRPTPPCDTSSENRRFFWKFDNDIHSTRKLVNIFFWKYCQRICKFCLKYEKVLKLPPTFVSYFNDKTQQLQIFLLLGSVFAAKLLLFSQVFLFQFCLDEERGSSSLHASF